MPGIHHVYTKEIYSNLRYRPTWLPGTPMRLGTVGLLEDGIFRPVTDLATLNISFTEVLDTDRDSLDFSSENGVAITFKGAGDVNSKFEVVPKASAGALIEFSRKRAVVLQLRGVGYHRIADQPALNQALMRSLVLSKCCH